jgi:hypothetical protein
VNWCNVPSTLDYGSISSAAEAARARVLLRGFYRPSIDLNWRNAMTRGTGVLAAVVLTVATAACGRTDVGVTTSVKAKFAQDDLVKAHQIDVATRNGVVTLTGDVDSAAARQQAVRLAQDTDGVTDVIDELRVDVEATTGDFGDLDVDIEADRELERGVRETGEAIREGAEATADAARKAGKAARDAVTDDDRDSDRDGK